MQRQNHNTSCKHFQRRNNLLSKMQAKDHELHDRSTHAYCELLLVLMGEAWIISGRPWKAMRVIMKSERSLGTTCRHRSIKKSPRNESFLAWLFQNGENIILQKVKNSVTRKGLYTSAKKFLCFICKAEKFFKFLW